ncbi:MAG: hypothetical protein ACRYFS_05240 [Janthinobacterium lividum]
MNKPFLTLAAVLTAGVLVSAASAAPTKAAPAKVGSKMVTIYQADKCHMYYSVGQAKKFNYACPDSKGKMKMVKVSPAVAKMDLAKTKSM